MDRIVSEGHYLDGVALIDNHCHSITFRELSRDEFEDNLTEAPTRASAITSTFDSAAGLTLLKECGRLLGLEAPVDAQSYLRARGAMAPETLAASFFAAAGVEVLMVDEGYNSAYLATTDRLEEVSGAKALRVLRLETLAEQVLAATMSATSFYDDFTAAVTQAASGAIGLKSIAAYRFGLDLDADIATPSDVAVAAEAVVADLKSGGAGRISSRTLCSFIAHAAVRATKLPIQFHVGYGDPDLQLDRCNPALLTPFIRTADTLGIPVILLHCYPYQREAAYLASSFANVYFDLGLAMNFVGHNAPRIFSEALELAPFSKVLYSSDAYGLAELHFLGSLAFRRSVEYYLADLRDRELADGAYLSRLALMFARDNATRAYRL